MMSRAAPYRARNRAGVGTMNELEQTVTDEGRLWAILSYAGFLVGLPLGIIPMVMRNDAYALHHGKIATTVYLAALATSMAVFVLGTIVSFVTCGLGSILMIPALLLVAAWPLTTAIHGLVITLNREWAEPLGDFGLAERLFGSLQLDDRAP